MILLFTYSIISLVVTWFVILILFFFFFFFFSPEVFYFVGPFYHFYLEEYFSQQGSVEINYSIIIFIHIKRLN